MELQSRSADETTEIGRRLGKSLKKGSVVCLYGELGSGKTTMIKGIASVFGVAERDITSASFVIIAEHEGDVPFYHIDLYRLEARDVSQIGLHEYLEGDGVSVIEWAERAEELIPDESIRVRLSQTGENSRAISIEGVDL